MRMMLYSQSSQVTIFRYQSATTRKPFKIGGYKHGTYTGDRFGIRKILHLPKSLN